jgi:hypothetical protein
MLSKDKDNLEPKHHPQNNNPILQTININKINSQKSTNNSPILQTIMTIPPPSTPTPISKTKLTTIK